MQTLKSLFSAVVLLLAGCDFVSTRQFSAEQIQRNHWHWESQHQRYTRYARKAVSELGQQLLLTEPVDAGQFCWSYTGLDREARIWFWSDLLAAISKLESNHNESLQYRERFADVNGQRVISRGLLQLSVESSQNYQCGLENATQLHSPEQNIRCATRILNKWVAQDHAISVGNLFSDQWQGGARYWSVLRDAEKRSLIQQRMQNEAYCHSTRFDRLAYRR